MDSRVHGKYPQWGRYKFPYYLHLIAEYIGNGKINIQKDQDGNGYVSFSPEKHQWLYKDLEQRLIIPRKAITEINLNITENKLDIYTFYTVSSNGLKNLEREFRVGYGLNDCIGIHIDIKPELAILYQQQIFINNRETPCTEEVGNEKSE